MMASKRRKADVGVGGGVEWAAKMLGVSVRKLQQFVKEGKLAYISVSDKKNAKRFLPRHIEEYCERGAERGDLLRGGGRMSCDTQVLSYGGGRQTVAMSILVAQGKLPRPDRVVVADTGRENPSTWEYLEAYTRPLLASVGLEVEVAPHTLATVDLHANNGDLILPVYTATGKFKAYCSNEWKQYVIRRHLRAAGVLSATNWIGFAIDESRRIKPERPGPWRKRYPLTELMLAKRDCREIIDAFGWPMPEVSSCWMCPNKHNSEWRSIRDRYPEKWEEACKLDEELRADDIADGHAGVYLHHSRVPLRLADLSQSDPHDALQCGLGTCFI